MSQIKHILKKYKKTNDDEDVKELKKILANNLGYFPKFAEWIFTKQTDLNNIESLLQLLKTIKIDKQISEFKTPENLYDYLIEKESKINLNKVIKSIPSKARKNVSDRVRNLLFNNIENYQYFIDFFSKKGGTLKTEDQLYLKITNIISSLNGGWSYKKLIRKIKTKIFLSRFFNSKLRSEGKVIYKDGKTIIVEIKQFSLSKIIGSTHWCISRKKEYWRNYLKEHNKQYFIYQTEYDSSQKESMIGVTVGPISNIILNAHYRDDTPCPKKELNKFREHLIGKQNIEINNFSDLFLNKIYDVKLAVKYLDENSVGDVSYEHLFRYYNILMDPTIIDSDEKDLIELEKNLIRRMDHYFNQYYIEDLKKEYGTTEYLSKLSKFLFVGTGIFKNDYISGDLTYISKISKFKYESHYVTLSKILEIIYEKMRICIRNDYFLGGGEGNEYFSIRNKDINYYIHISLPEIKGYIQNMTPPSSYDCVYDFISKKITYTNYISINDYYVDENFNLIKKDTSNKMYNSDFDSRQLKKELHHYIYDIFSPMYRYFINSINDLSRYYPKSERIVLGYR